MARKKISEFRAKSLLYQFLQRDYSGISIDGDEDFDERISHLDSSKRYVLKVDQGIKQRKKKGLVFFNVTSENIRGKIEELTNRGFSHFIIEEFLEHENFSEKYFAVERIREGKKILYSLEGGVDIEDNKETIKSFVVGKDEDLRAIASVLEVSFEVIRDILSAFDDYYFSFLEINPLVVHSGEFYFLDTAVEVDSAAEFFVSGAWGSSDFRENGNRKKTLEEQEVERLKEGSPASFSYEILNPDGAIFLLLSGGGASLVTADEIYQKGKGEKLANYGEYSGNPNQEETYIYTKQILATLLKSKAPKKSVIISGGVANFTDVRNTFRGIITAMSEVSSRLREDNVKVFVRRGGPYQEEGLSMMRDFLEKEELLGAACGPDMVLTDIVKPAIDHL